VPYRLGSQKDKIVASDLIEERANGNFDKEEMANFLDHIHKEKKECMDFFASMPETKNHHNFYEFTTDEKQKDLWKRIKFIHSNPKLR
jgi:hypothetical protein